MNKIIANYHTHNQLCNHAVGNANDYVSKAVELGFTELGLSDHGPIPTSFMTKEEYLSNLCYRNMSVDGFFNIYLKELDEVIEKYNGKIKIYKGLEVEFIKEELQFYKDLREKLDYLLVGIHYFKANEKIVNSYSEINYSNVIDYAKTAVDAMSTGLYTCLVHPDLFMFQYKNINGQRRFDEAAITASKMIIEAAIKYDVYLEVNCNGISNSVKYKSDEWLYPYDEFWKLAKEYKDLKIIIGVDAHNPNALGGNDVSDVISFVNKLGLNVSQTMKLK